jgi:oligosaccharide repeat unit polymerase
MSTAIQSALYLTALLVSVVLVLSGALSLYACLWLSLLLYAGLLTLAWRKFDGGRHPCFLFLGMLMLFQMGRLVGYALGATADPFNVVVQTVIPLTVSPASSEITILIVLLSASVIYAVCSWNAPQITLEPGWEQTWLAASYVLLALSFPFVLYKNYEYFQFIRSHGGYLAIFTDSEAIAKSAGALVRIMSLVAANAFLLVYLIERRGKRLALVTTVFLSTSVLELAIGLRGKVFLFLITLWFLHNLKTGKRFRLATLAIVVLVGSFAAVAISGFREMRSTAVVGPAGFIAGQGISMGVTQVAVQYRPLFQPHAKTYLANELLQAFYPGSHFGQGELFDNDISVFLNVDAFRAGFGTGSSYLAEAWIAGGLAAVVIVSVLIGLALRALHRVGASFVGAVLVALVLPSVIYLPRAQLLSPIAAGLKSGLIFLPMIPVLWLIRWLFHDPEIEQQFLPVPPR